MNNPNRELLLSAARLLEPLLEELVFVGGCATALLISDEAAGDVRPTKDVDVIVELSTHRQYEAFSKRLRALGFQEDSTEGAPICRWRHPQDVILDLMPTDERILGFSNPWYRSASGTAVQVELQAGLEIRLVTAPLFCATKLSAFRGRGGGDYAASHDLEDLIAIVDGRSELLDEIRRADATIRDFIASEVRQLLRTPGFLEALPGYLLPDSASQARLPTLMKRLNGIANRPPVIFIPGFPASELVDAANNVVFPPSLKTLTSPTKKQRFLDTVTDLSKLTAGDPIREAFFGFEKQAQALYDILRLYGYSISNPAEFRAIGGDWRRGVDDTLVQASLRSAIQQMAHGSAKVLIIAHSTGGLVLRQLLAADPGLGAKIEHILALGVPWAGTLKSFRFLVKGQSTGIPGARLSAGESMRIIRGAQAAYDLLPPPRDLANPADVPPSLARKNNADVSPMTETSWIPASSRTRMESLAEHATRLRRGPDVSVSNVPVTNVAGFGAETDTHAELTTGSATISATAEGDGTVPHASATWLRGAGVRSFSLPVGVYPTGGIPLYHAQIWDAPPMLNLFDELLGDAQPEPFIAVAIDADDASMGGQRPMKVHISGAAANGAPLNPMKVTFSDLKVPLSKTVNGRGTITIPKASLPIATSSHFVSFNAIVTWAGGGRREVGLIYQRS